VESSSPLILSKRRRVKKLFAVPSSISQHKFKFDRITPQWII